MTPFLVDFACAFEAQAPATPEELVYDEKALGRIFKRRRPLIRAWLVEGYLPARWLPDGRPVVLRDELLEALRNLPRTPR